MLVSQNQFLVEYRPILQANAGIVKMNGKTLQYFIIANHLIVVVIGITAAQYYSTLLIITCIINERLVCL